MSQEKMLKMRTSPHIVSNFTTKRLMLDVIIALSLPLAAGVLFFGAYTLLIVAVTVFSCVFTEHIYAVLRNKKSTIGDLSAVVTGIILALNMPPDAPLYLCVIGGVFAIFFVKLLFGGLGKNFANPAAAARVFLLLAYAPMTSFIGASIIGDFVTASTYLSAGETALKTTFLGFKGQSAINLQLFLGYCAGSIGEVSKLAILISFCYLVIRKVIGFVIPLSVLISSAFFALIFTKSPINILPQLLSGSIMFGAVFMATDYSTSPMTFAAKIIFGIGIGFITMLIRCFGAYPEGVSFAILFMNLTVPFLDKYIIPVRFGENRKPILKTVTISLIAVMLAVIVATSSIFALTYKTYEAKEYNESSVLSAKREYSNYYIVVKGFVNEDDKSESGWVSGSVTVKVTIKGDKIKDMVYVTDNMKPNETNPKGLDYDFFSQYFGVIPKDYEFNSQSTSAEKKRAVDNAVLGAIRFYKSARGETV